MPKLFCFGLGYTALRLARHLRDEGWTVAGTCRTDAKLPILAAEGIRAYPFDRHRPLDDPGFALGGATHILLSIPPGDGGDPVIAEHGGDLVGRRSVQWVGYLSTTGVYGDRHGGWVDEADDLLPSTERGRRRLAAEQAWLDLWRDGGLPVHLFRLVGIYGPGRSAIDQVRQGRARRIDKPGQVFNRIHVDDIVGVLLASMARPDPGTAYNVADDDPAPSHEVVADACRLLGRPIPPMIPFDQVELTPMARSFYAENKRVRNDRIKRDLGVDLLYPSYRDGLRAQLAAEEAG